MGYLHIKDTEINEYTASGLETGLKYAWRVGYENIQTKTMSWSPEQSFKIGKSETRSDVYISSGIAVEDFRMVSFTQWPNDPIFLETLGSVMGPELDRQNYRIATYDQERGCFTEYGCDYFLGEPGRAYWFLARDGLEINVNGVPVSLNHDFELRLDYNTQNSDGWNMIASPNDADYYWGDIRVVVCDEDNRIIFGPAPASEMNYPNPYIDNRLWRAENGMMFSGTFRIDRNQGYWVRAKQEGVSLVFPVSAQTDSNSVRPPDPGNSETDPDVTPITKPLTATGEDYLCPEIDSGAGMLYCFIIF